MASREVGEAPNWVRTLSTVGSPIAMATALLFYFGWVRTRTQAQAFGYDPSLLNFSLQDYLLKSINVLFLPAVVIALAGLAFTHLHRRLLAIAQVNSRVASRCARAGRFLVRSWPLWLVVTVILLRIPATKVIASPTGLTLGVLAAVYGHILLRECDGTARWPTITTTFVSVIVAFALFWSTERIARVTGEAFADYYRAKPQKLIAVAVYSQKNLEIGAPGVTATRLGADSAYTFRYTGLRLLEGTPDRYVLMNEMGGYVLLLRDSETVRLEFAGALTPR